MRAVFNYHGHDGEDDDSIHSLYVTIFDDNL